ncbi:hypothetical protein A5886_000931 [Enterococcus sp. 8G7_MSG3316]|uniref:NAD-dependent epimerase/dehydratase domain-containing protein n=1 Tax=Candidatus Enterococcus testudinis TaxID=1834191 RepID=A0A242A491_9ENTE|nr:NAD-dependent epimerase/dehydratase family protein [Enterococcus sp. 8G7_MSG3316]OTN75855.1 hypothetical protein A5886_000931 [Enterococcus sp. 8G7_MSG3316]
MRRILITGENSYIGTSLVKWMSDFKDEYQFDTISVKGNSWRSLDFSEFDAIIHLAAIVHVKEKNDDLYFKVNRDLAVEIANKAREYRVEQFIFLSTMSVFGMEKGKVSSKTNINPKTAYGKSKYEAENEILKLENEHFKVAILRPPMIYGPNSVGNYSKLSKLAKRLPIFPKINNKRSMLYINNLCCFIKLILDYQLHGTFHPQNRYLVNTSDLVKEIRLSNGKKVVMVHGMDMLIKWSSNLFSILNKIFGDLYYDKSTLGYPDTEYNGIRFDYQERNFAKSIEESEK